MKSIVSWVWAKSRARTGWVMRTLPKRSSFESNSPTTRKVGFAPVWPRRRKLSPTARSWSDAKPSETTASESLRLRSTAGPPFFHSTLRASPMLCVGAVTCVLLPPGRRLACTERIVATDSTPGTLSAAAAAGLGIGEKPSVFWIRRPPAKFSSMTLATEVFSPAAKTVTKVTRASPTISAAAVTAVRLGLRCEFSRASRPVRRRTRSSGQPATAASGGTSRGLKRETPRTIATAPAPIRAAAAPASALPKRPIRSIARPPTPSRTESPKTTSERRRLGGCSAACSAAIGGTRVDRSAGIIEETAVTTIPTRSATITVRDSITRPVVGRSTPNASSRAFSSSAIT